MIKILILQFLVFSIFAIQAHGGGLAIRTTAKNPACLFYGDEPVHAFGPSPQNILTYLPKGNGNDISDWADWAGKFGVNHVRSYPPSIKVSEPAQNIFEKSKIYSSKFDLNKFNQKYFDELRKACLLLKTHEIIVHLQFWQAVYWKKAWEKCYYNRKNNINPDISADAGPGEFVTMKNKALLDHQKKYVEKILDATGELGNVFYDIMNEIGNGTGKSEQWVWEIIETINAWEVKNGIDVLITLNDEGGKRMGSFSLECPGLDLIVKDLGRYDEHIEARKKYSKPTISVRNIDYDYESGKRFWFFGENNLEINTDSSLQTRGRKYWWRMFMAGVQSAGGYADAVPRKDFYWFSNMVTNKFGISNFFELNYTPTYRLNSESEDNFSNFKRIISQVKNYETLTPSSEILLNHPVKNSYILQSNEQAIIYLESPNGRAGYKYSKKNAKLSELVLADGVWSGSFYFPVSGKSSDFFIKIKRGKGDIVIPEFQDDLAIILNQR